MMKIKNIIINAPYYFRGHIRYRLYYSKELYKINLSWLIPTYIREQIEMRIASMNKECYDTGSCIKCGCTTTALQMASKSCEGDCYPAMVDKKTWKNFMYRISPIKDDNYAWFTKKSGNGLIFIKKEKYDLGDKNNKFRRNKTR